MLTVEEVNGRTAYRRFLELPFALFRSEARWAPPVLSYERARIDGRRNPQLSGEVRYLLARRQGRIVGRVFAHEDGRFGGFDVEDEVAGVALLEAAGDVLSGPFSFAEEQDGALVAGFDVLGVTGRQWHPPTYQRACEAAGLTRVGERPVWRIAATIEGPLPRSGGDPPSTAGPYADPRLVFRDVAAVPDLAPALRSAGPRSAWAVARRARQRRWEGCTVVRLDGEPAELVPGIVSAAARAGYRWVLAPWTPGDSDPETVHAVYGPGGRASSPSS